jgi:uncharacterized integral membrane protein (TIGR00697 family)
MMTGTRKELVFLILAGLFITNAVIAEVIGGKLIQFGPFVLSVGVLSWPFVFIMTDLVNEYFGKTGVRRLTFVTVGLIIFAFAILLGAIQIPAVDFSPVKDEAFSQVFGQSLWIIVGSILAFLFSQLLDVWVFWIFRNRTGKKMLWVRATGSTIFSQLFDTIIVLGIAFYLPGKLSLEEFIKVASSNYTYKIGVAIAMTPVIYVAHYVIEKYLKDEPAN